MNSIENPPLSSAGGSEEKKSSKKFSYFSPKRTFFPNFATENNQNKLYYEKTINAFGIGEHLVHSVCR